uniref:Inositol-1-monophosphatase n=1 Tax=Gallus gallus TaxID=9031 RepID=A0A8V0XPK2_CHICK
MVLLFRMKTSVFRMLNSSEGYEKSIFSPPFVLFSDIINFSASLVRCSLRFPVFLIFFTCNYQCFIGEESVAAGEGSILTDNPTWIIDPIDGTTNFVHRFPFVAVSIGFVVNKKIEFGIVYSCVEDKMYTARKGKGAFCNGQKLKVSGQEDITKSLLVTELGSNRDPETIKIVLSNMERLLSIPIHGIRAVGTAAVNMCLVAAGGADAYYEMGIHCWDMAGAGIIITEAGGVLLDVSGGPFDLMSRRIIAASSRPIAERIAKALQIIPLKRDDATN